MEPLAEAHDNRSIALFEPELVYCRSPGGSLAEFGYRRIALQCKIERLGIGRSNETWSCMRVILRGEALFIGDVPDPAPFGPRSPNMPVAMRSETPFMAWTPFG